MNHTQRKVRSDQIMTGEFFYTYILQLDNGSFYVGSTNNPAARFTEHAIGAGATATSGRRFDVVLVHQFVTRREAEYNEQRIQRALDKGPANVAAMVDNFQRINRMVAPQKSFSELRREEEAYEREMRRLIHKWVPKGLMRKAECGWEAQSYEPYPGTLQFAAYHHPESWDLDRLAGNADACPDCLAKRPLAHAEERVAIQDSSSNAAVR